MNCSNSGIGIMAGYFILYGVRAGTKTQDVFKGFLGASGLAGGALLSIQPGVDVQALSNGVLTGAGIYVLIALALTSIFAFVPATSAPPPPASTPVTTPAPALLAPTSGFNGLAYLLARILIGEDFKSNGQR